MRRVLYFLLFLISAIADVKVAEAQYITVSIAGAGSGGIGQMPGATIGSPTRSSSCSYPYDVCVGADQNIYFTDMSNTLIRKINARTGGVSIFAGGGSSSSDGIPATSASLYTVGNIAVDHIGNVYFVAMPNRIRKIDASTNFVSTVAGGGSMLIDGISATDVLLDSIRGVCIGPGNDIFVLAGNRVKKIDAGTGIISTIAGTGVPGYTGDGGPATAAKLKRPQYIAADQSGNLYFGDQDAFVSTGVIRRINTITGIITTVIGPTGSYAGSIGTSTLLLPLSGLVCDASGNVIFNEVSCSTRMWKPSTDTVYPIAGDPGIEAFYNDTTSLFAWMHSNYGVSVDARGNIYVADRDNNRIRKLIPVTHTPTFAFGRGQYVTPCPGLNYSIDSLLWVTDKDSAQTETWTLISTPTYGAVSGFPSTAISNGIHETVKPTGLVYRPSNTYFGSDSFKVKVSDGIFSDTMTVYITVNDPGTVSISGPSAVCESSSITLTSSAMLGVWRATNPSATVSSTMATMVNGILAGVDTIAYVFVNGCARKPVTVNPLPALGIVTGNDTVCLGGTSTLTSTITGGIWISMSPSNITIGSSTGIMTGVHAGSSMILYTTSNAWCTASDTTNVTAYAPYVGSIGGPTSICAGGVPHLCTNSVVGGIWSVSNTHASIGSSSGVVTGNTLGLDTVRYTVAGGPGCTSRASHTVNVTPLTLPAVGAIAGPSNLCVGLMGSFTDTVGAGTWSISNPSASISGSGDAIGLSIGIDTVIYTVTDGCGVNHAYRTVNVIDVPLAGTIVGPDEVCLLDHIALTNTGATTSGVWTLTNTNAAVTSSGIVYGVNVGIDTIIYRVYNECGIANATKAVAIVDCEASDLPVFNTEPFVNVYPNPVSSILTVSLSSVFANLSVSITDALGRTILRDEVDCSSGVKQIDVSSLPSGVYLLAVTGDGLSHVTRLVVRN